MSYQALYRAWRPQTFSDLVGQPHVKQTLSNAVSRDQTAHAYLFSGPRGTGKTSVAKILARAVNCPNRQGAEPCNECSSCRSIMAGSNVDVEEIDAASNRGVDEIRQLRDKVQYAPTQLARKVYIVDEVHMLTTEAFNALLKTLEEPPAHALFVLATTEPHKIPATIVSRCQRFDFRRIAPEDITSRLQKICEAQGWACEEEALWKIAQTADGGLRDALGLLEQTAAYGGGVVSGEHAAHALGGLQLTEVLDMVQALAERNLQMVMELLMRWYDAGKDPARIIHEMLQVMRDLFVVKLSATRSEEHLGQTARYEVTAQACQTDWLLSSVSKLGETYTHLRFVDQPKLVLEAALLSLVPQAAATHQQPEERGTHVSQRADARQHHATVPAEPRRPVAAEAKPQSRASDSRRKMDVLKDLHRRAETGILTDLTGRWDDILQRVRKEQIQTHAWLLYGQPVLATGEHVVLSFASRIHRDAVMKPEERSVIEECVAQATGRTLGIMALLRSDWDAFVQTQKDDQGATDESDWVERAVRLFGSDVVEIRDGE